MARQIQLRRGNKAQNDAFTGVEGELTMVTDTKGIRLHDGSKQGGYEIPVLVDIQRPTADNNYTWYRLYSDGWVEQGGVTPSIAWNTQGDTETITLPITMQDIEYSVQATMRTHTTVWGSPGCIAWPGTTSTIIVGCASNTTNQGSATCAWLVYGYSA